MIQQGQLAPVSVVIPCFNCGLTIKRAVVSVALQSQLPAEVILVDDASDQDTLRVLRELADAYPGWVSVLRLEENRGAASARNAGWALATQPHLAFLDADDAWHPKKIEIQYAYMRDHPDTVLSGHRHRVLAGRDARPDWSLGKWSLKSVKKWSFLLANQFITPSAMLRSDIPHRFSEGRRYMEDRLLWLEIVCDGGQVAMLEVDLAAIYKMPYGAAGLSANLWQMTRADVDNYRLLHATGRLSLLSTYALMIFSLLKSLRRLGLLLTWRIRGNPIEAHDSRP